MVLALWYSRAAFTRCYSGATCHIGSGRYDLKRSNRLVLLIGIFLAIIAFVGIIVLQGKPSEGPDDTVKTEGPVVVATANIPLGSKVQTNQVKVVQLAVSAILPGAFEDPTQVVGKTVRVPITNGAQVTSASFSDTGSVTDIVVPAGKRAIAVDVDQTTGVGTVIKSGDYVDMIVGFTGDKFPVITLNPVDDSFTVVSGLNNTSVKVLIQGMQVLGTLLPPPPASTDNSGDTTTEGDTSTTLDEGQRQIVILAVDAQQSELIKFAQLDGNISLTLRSADDFLDPTTHQPLPDGPVPDDTTGIILKGLVDTYGVIPPELVETVLPAQASPTP
jgi:Flp pilus assembly protein CpaB